MRSDQVHVPGCFAFFMLNSTEHEIRDNKLINTTPESSKATVVPTKSDSCSILGTVVK